MTASLPHLAFRFRGPALCGAPLRGASRRGMQRRGVGGRARWWLWGVLPYLWLALFSEAFHTHAPLLAPAAWAIASTCSASHHSRAHQPHGAGVQDASPASKSLECLACQWLTCSVALLAALALALLGLARREFVAWSCADSVARASRFCSRGPPFLLMSSV